MVTVRSVCPKDAPRLAEIYGWYVLNTAISFEYDAPTEEEFRKRIETVTESYPYLAVEEDGIIRGYAYAARLKLRKAYDRSCEVSIYIEKGMSGRGYGRLLYSALEEKLREMNMRNLYAAIACPVREDDEFLDSNSLGFHRHMGYETVGVFHSCGQKFGHMYDLCWGEKIIGK